MDFVCHLGTPEGRVVRETRAAANETVLRSELERQGLRIFAIERRLGLAMPTEFLARFRRRRKIPYKTLMVFNQELAALLKAGSAAPAGAQPDARAPARNRTSGRS